MKYFTKYLPVEGEIKKGDKFKCAKGENDRILVNEGIVPIKDTIHYQKVKLFLCSRDIQVGDEFFDNKGNKYVYQTEDFEESYFESDLAYKVIGEVSPDATWVKEGMEFNDDQIMKDYPRRDRNIILSYDVIGIKCSCCGAFK